MDHRAKWVLEFSEKKESEDRDLVWEQPASAVMIPAAATAAVLTTFFAASAMILIFVFAVKVVSVSFAATNEKVVGALVSFVDEY
mmetsp:Transcript_52111/g.62711  ORF Transcript_52111/g.62711 Transcript_52111/m.62711 type:complete len:85 (+) Transcript_52111:2-256(+)